MQQSGPRTTVFRIKSGGVDRAGMAGQSSRLSPWLAGHRRFAPERALAPGIDIRRHPVGSKAGKQSGDKRIARTGGIHADNRFSAEMDKLLLECGDDARFTLSHQQ